MTLSTNVIIRQPINPGELFYDLLVLLSKMDGRPVDAIRWKHEPEKGQYLTQVGQGLDVWTWVFYGVDGPLRYHDDDDIASYREDHGPDWQPPEWNEHCVRVNFDTGYSSGGPDGPGGAGCSDTHAFLIAAVYHWCATRGVTDLWWSNEFTGDYFQSTLDLPHFGDPFIVAEALRDTLSNAVDLSALDDPGGPKELTP